jgi:hypothetical protein
MLACAATPGTKTKAGFATATGISRLLADACDFPWTLLLDAALAAIRHLCALWRGEIVVCERFVLDMLVDLSVATGETDLLSHLPGRLFLRLMPACSQVIILDLDAPMVRSRRPDLHFDHRLDERLAAYRQLCAGLEIEPFSANGPSSDPLRDRQVDKAGYGADKNGLRQPNRGCCDGSSPIHSPRCSRIGYFKASFTWIVPNAALSWGWKYSWSQSCSSH